MRLGGTRVSGGSDEGRPGRIPVFGRVRPRHALPAPLFDLFKRKPAEGSAEPPAAERVPFVDRATEGGARPVARQARRRADRRLRRRKLDDEALDELETALLTADVGVDATQHLIDDLKARWRARGRRRPAGRARGRAGRSHRAAREAARRFPRERPFVIMLAGRQRRGQDDVDRQARQVAAAAGPVGAPGRRRHVPRRGARAARSLGRAQQRRGDPAGRRRRGRGHVRRRRAARARGIDVVLADTAGRLPTQAHLMEELRKVKRVLGKALPGAPHEVLLVLDANTGQNALAQVKAFDDARRPHRPRPDQARRHRQGRRRRGHRQAARRSRCSSSASARGSTTCGRSPPPSSSMRCCPTRVPERGATVSGRSLGSARLVAPRRRPRPSQSPRSCRTNLPSANTRLEQSGTFGSP